MVNRKSANLIEQLSKETRSLLTSKDTGVVYVVRAKPIGEYYDGFFVEVVKAEGVAERVMLPFGDTRRIHASKYFAAEIGAINGLLGGEIEQISGGLVNLVEPVYNPDKKFQLSKIRKTESNNHPSAFFTAHFMSSPVEDLLQARQTSANLRTEVFENLDELSRAYIINHATA
jgi:hypothetical protein